MKLKKAYKKLAMKYTHLPVPEYSTDYNIRELSEVEVEEFKQIQIAYEVLINPISRTQYDMKMARESDLTSSQILRS
ncbi:MAG: DnaJ domain-containing protein [Proteobacteria bacterium]|nr:DnaJ domain-containing protein [Pseudomonadota bacterium]